MAIKKIIITEDIIKLIRALNFQSFSFGEKYKMSKIADVEEDLEYCVKKCDELVEKCKKENNYATLKLIEDCTYNTSLAYEQSKHLHESARNLLDLNSRYAWGIDQWSPWGGQVITDMALILGKMDEVYPETLYDVDGPKFPQETMDYINQLYNTIIDNLPDIINLVFQFIDKGGLTPGTYKCINYQGVWEKIE